MMIDEQISNIFILYPLDICLLLLTVIFNSNSVVTGKKRRNYTVYCKHRLRVWQ